MLGSNRSRLALVLLVAAWSNRADAHFELQAPANIFEQNALGDPQKAPPCGDDGNATLTGEVTTFAPGDTVTITLEEKIFHPGHYRVALALNDPSELPAEPPVTAGTTPCGSAEIDPAPMFPVLADGMLEHDTAFAGPQSFDITLPDDVTCEACTLQVIEFMSNHGLNNPGGCYYHHCATIAIEGDPSNGDSSGGGSASDSGGADDGSGDDSSADSSGGAGDDGAADDGVDDAGADGADDAADGGSGGGTAGTGGADGADGGNGGDDGGCGCTSGGRSGLAWMLLTIPAVVLRRRRSAARG